VLLSESFVRFSNSQVTGTLTCSYLR